MAINLICSIFFSNQNFYSIVEPGWIFGITYNYFMWNKVAKNVKNSSIKNINFFINACVWKWSCRIKFFDCMSNKPCLLFCSARSLVNKVEDIQYISLILQKLSDDDNLDAVKSVHQSQLWNWVETWIIGQYKMMKYLICV